MDEKEKKFFNRAVEFIEYFNVKQDDEAIYLTSGGNSVIMNPNTEWKEFLGHSINGVAEYVAKNTGRKTIWEYE